MPRNPDVSADSAVSALQRGFAVLDCFVAAGGPLGNGEVAQATGIPRPTVSRLIGTLVGLGHLRPAGDGEKYELAAGVVRLAQAFLGAIDVRAHARPHLRALAEATGASAFLGVRDGDDMLVVEAARARSAVAVMGADVGTRMALATSALGRSWLAAADGPTRAAVLARWRTAGGAANPSATAAVEASIERARRCGHAVSLGEWHPSINAAAVAVRTAGGEVVSINCGSPSFVLPAERLRGAVIPQLLAAAEALAVDIGGSAGLAAMHGHAAGAGGAPSGADSSRDPGA